MELSLVRRRGGPDPDLDRRTVGNALVVHPATGMTDEAQALALGVAADTEHDLVVVDLPVDSPISLWESVAKALPRRRRGVRLVIGGRSRETSALAGQWLAERLGRPVLAPDGSVIPSAGGALFVHSGRGSGWVRFQPGRPPKWEAKRFPRPSWDSGVTAELTSTSSRGLAEPLPGGLWIRPVGVDGRLGFHRSALIRGLPALPDTMTIVLGCPGCPPLTIDDAARLWTRLPEPVRHRARFVQYGPMSVPSGTTLGQALADLLGREVGFYSGLPIGTPHDLDVWTVLYDGSLGWATFARELAYVPRQASPRLLDHRVPLDGLKEIEPAVYWYSPDAVLEVVQSGLLLRPPSAGSRTTEAVREVTLDPSVHNLTYDVSEGTDERMHLLAEDLLARLDEHTRSLSRILPAAALLAERSRATVSRRAAASIEAPALEVVRQPSLLTISERLDPGAVIAGSLVPVTITTAAPPRTSIAGPEVSADSDSRSGGLPAASAGAATLPPPAVPPAGVPGALAAEVSGGPVTVSPVGVPGGPARGFPTEPAAGSPAGMPAAELSAGPVTVPPVGVSGGPATGVPAEPEAVSPASAQAAELSAGSVTAQPPVGMPSGPAGLSALPTGVPDGLATRVPAGPVTAPPPAVPPAGVLGGRPTTPATPGPLPAASPSDAATTEATIAPGVPSPTPGAEADPATHPARSSDTPTPQAPPAPEPTSAEIPAEPPALPPPAVPPAGVSTGPAPLPPPAVPPAGVAGGPAPQLSTVTSPTGPAAQTPAAEAPAHPTKNEARLQPTPAAEASALLPKRGVDKEREWLRKSLGAEYGLMSNAAARILSEHPGFQGALAASSADVLTDAVAVQLYLSGKGAAIDAGLRGGRNGPHVPIARCVVAGLGRLPSHRGPAGFAASPTAAQWALYRTRKALTEWGFLHALTTPASPSDGDTDILVWSVTARRTKLLEPAEGVADRALFVPGTSFKVLEVTEPGDDRRGLVLLRELTVSEVDETGRVAADRISLDELALESLRRELEVWAESDGREPIDPAAAARFGAVPGLV